MTAVCIGGSVTAAVFSAGLFLRKHPVRSRYYLAGILACLSFSLGFSAGRYAENSEAAQPVLPVLSLPVGIGMLMLLLFIELTRLETERRRDFRLLPLLLLPSLASDFCVHVLRIHRTGYGFAVPILSTLHAVSGCIVLSLCVGGIVYAFRRYTVSTMTGAAWMVLSFSGTGALALIFGLTALLAGVPQLYRLMDGILSAAVVTGAVASFRYPGLLEGFREDTVKRRYARSCLGGLDTDELARSMTDLVRSRTLYRLEEFSLERLSRLMGLSRHQVSELLNDRMGMSFTTFLNGFRIDEAKEKLRSRPDLTILAIALETGFSNKTSFNEAFKARTGITPREYRVQAFAGESKIR